MHTYIHAYIVHTYKRAHTHPHGRPCIHTTYIGTVTHMHTHKIICFNSVQIDLPQPGATTLGSVVDDITVRNVPVLHAQSISA